MSKRIWNDPSGATVDVGIDYRLDETHLTITKDGEVVYSNLYDPDNFDMDWDAIGPKLEEHGCTVPIGLKDRLACDWIMQQRMGRSLPPYYYPSVPNWNEVSECQLA